eukprot:4520727-Prymnesium_polylepis.1
MPRPAGHRVARGRGRVGRAEPAEAIFRRGVRAHLRAARQALEHQEALLACLHHERATRERERAGAADPARDVRRGRGRCRLSPVRDGGWLAPARQEHDVHRARLAHGHAHERRAAVEGRECGAAVEQSGWWRRRRQQRQLCSRVLPADRTRHQTGGTRVRMGWRSGDAAACVCSIVAVGRLRWGAFETRAAALLWGGCGGAVETRAGRRTAGRAGEQSPRRST